MAVESYIYSIASDVPAGAVDLGRLENEIRSSGITIALDGSTIKGDVLTVFFKATLPAEDKTLLDGDTAGPAGGVLGSHSGTPLPDEQYDADGVLKVTLKTSQEDGAAKVAIVGRRGSDKTLATHNFSDKTTWFGDSVRETEEVLTDSGDGLTWTSGHANWIDVEHGKILDESDIRASYLAVVEVDSVEMTPRNPWASDFSGGGDYYVDYASGSVVFESSQAGKSVVATYSRAGGSTFYIRPAAGKQLVIEDSEVQFSADIEMTSGIFFAAFGLVDVFAPQLMPGVPSGTKIELRRRCFDTLDQLLDDARGAYPVIPAMGGVARGFSSARYGFPFAYKTTNVLHDAYGMEIRVWVDGDIPFGGERATATFYCGSEDDDVAAS